MAAMTGLVLIRAMTATDGKPVRNDVLNWHYAFIAAVGLYFVLHILASVALAIDDARRAG